MNALFAFAAGLIFGAGLGAGAAGGIDSAAALLVLLNGRIAGISGIVGGLLMPRRGEIVWRLAFAAGRKACQILLRRCDAPSASA